MIEKLPWLSENSKKVLDILCLKSGIQAKIELSYNHLIYEKVVMMPYLWNIIYRYTNKSNRKWVTWYIRRGIEERYD